MPPASQDTIDRLKEFIGGGTLRMAAVRLGLHEEQASLLSAVLGGTRNVSRSRENLIRLKLNLFPRGIDSIEATPSRYLAYLIRNRVEL